MGSTASDVKSFKVPNTFESRLWRIRDNIPEVLRILDVHGRGTWCVISLKGRGRLIIRELRGCFISSESVVDISIKFDFYCLKKEKKSSEESGVHCIHETSE